MNTITITDADVQGEAGSPCCHDEDRDKISRKIQAILCFLILFYAVLKQSQCLDEDKRNVLLLLLYFLKRYLKTRAAQMIDVA